MNKETGRESFTSFFLGIIKAHLYARGRLGWNETRTIPPSTTPLHGLFKCICRSGANPEKALCIRGGAMQVYHHNQ